MLSKSAEYGLRATLYLATLQEEGYVSIRDISERLGISFHFLTKIFQKLTQAGLLRSYRGPNGGVALTRGPEDITLYDLVVAIDGPELFTECVLGLPGCGEQKPCPLHEAWAAERERLRTLFAGATLASLATRVRNEQVRLAAEVT
ncbi:MAG: Rrf2 family transcriptional regulator [Bacteroidetes bacterium]|nr:MAG: Rrf2 family transcriptional regulator [Bacteroidota bacterium]